MVLQSINQFSSYDWAIQFVHKQIRKCNTHGYFGFYIDDASEYDTGKIMIETDNLDVKMNYTRLLKLMEVIIDECSANGCSENHMFSLKGVCGDIVKKCEMKIETL